MLAGVLPPERRFGPNIRISDISEGRLIGACLPYLHRADSTILPSGDDCAIIRANGGYVVTTDVLIEDSHYRRDWSTAFIVGGRAAAQNLADVVAMGAWPTCVVIGLALPRCLEADWVVECVAGLSSYCQRYGCEVVGGDITCYLGSGEDKFITVNIAAMGGYDAGPLRPADADAPTRVPSPRQLRDIALLRSGARVGDVVGVVGTLGLSQTGLQYLLDGDEASSCQPPQVDAATRPFLDHCKDIYRCPDPPIDLLMRLLRLGRPHAMMDVSDGLLKDAGRMAVASAVSMDIDSAAMAPFVSQLGRIYPTQKALRHALTGGEDHAFLVTLPPDLAREWETATAPGKLSQEAGSAPGYQAFATAGAERTIPDRFYPLGRVVATPPAGRHQVTVDGHHYAGPQGWDHGAMD